MASRAVCTGFVGEDNRLDAVAKIKFHQDALHVAGHKLIEGHLQALAERLPGPVVKELADGLAESFEDQLERLADPDAAARAALADFGDADTITAAFVRASPRQGHSAPPASIARILLVARAVPAVVGGA